MTNAAKPQFLNFAQFPLLHHSIYIAMTVYSYDRIAMTNAAKPSIPQFRPIPAFAPIL